MANVRFTKENVKEYIRLRLASEHVFKVQTEKLLKEFAKKIAEIMYKNRSLSLKMIKELVDQAIDELKRQLLATWRYILETMLAEEDDDKYGFAILPDKAYSADTVVYVQSTLNRWIDEREDEIMTVCYGCMVQGMPLSAAQNACQLPYWSEDVQEILEEARQNYGWVLPYFAPERKRGQWRDTSRKIESVAEDLMAAGMMWALYNSAKDSGGVKFWKCYRGSSYPCAYCDDECSYLHTLADPMPPFHSHCCCYAVPVFI